MSARKKPIIQIVRVRGTKMLRGKRAPDKYTVFVAGAGPEGESQYIDPPMTTLREARAEANRIAKEVGGRIRKTVLEDYQEAIDEFVRLENEVFGPQEYDEEW